MRDEWDSPTSSLIPHPSALHHSLPAPHRHRTTCRSEDTHRSTRRAGTECSSACRCVPEGCAEWARRARARMIALEQFVDGLVRTVLGERNIFEAAAERIIGTNGRVVDAEGGVDGGGDVFGADVAVEGTVVLR